MSTQVVERSEMWRNLIWGGIVGSLVGWVWSWLLAGGATVVLILVAIAAGALMVRATRTGSPFAYVGLIAAGVVLLFGSVMFSAFLFLGGGQVTIFHWLAESLIPMASAVALLLGAGPSFRFARTTVAA